MLEGFLAMLPWYIQVFIIVTLYTSYHLKFLQYITAVIWTLISINHVTGGMPSLISQLVFIWGTCLLVFLFRLRQLEKNKLKNLIVSINNPVYEASLRDLLSSNKNFKKIKKKEHYSLLCQSLQNAKYSICILSGNINDSISLEFLELLLNTLKKGVNIYFGYWHDYQTTQKLKPGFEKGLNQLLEIKERGTSMGMPGQLLLAEYSGYETLLIGDKSYIIFGGVSWLNQLHYKYDCSYKINDEELASKVQEKVVSMLEANYAKALKRKSKASKSKPNFP